MQNLPAVKLNFLVPEKDFSPRQKELSKWVPSKRSDEEMNDATPVRAAWVRLAQPGEWPDRASAINRISPMDLPPEVLGPSREATAIDASVRRPAPPGFAATSSRSGFRPDWKFDPARGKPE